MSRSTLLPLALVLAVTSACGAAAPEASFDAEAPAAPAEEAARLAFQAPTGGAPEVASDRKLVRHADFGVDVDDADVAVTAVEAGVKAAGGYVQALSIDGTREAGRVVSATLRVPASASGGFTDVVRGLGEVTHVSEGTDDVTADYVDLEERIRTKELHLQRLQGHFAGTGTIHDLVELEAEVARVTADLEAMKGRMRVLANQVDFATFTLTLREPGAPVVEPPDGVWDRLVTGVRDSATGVVNATGSLVVGGASAAPWVAWLGAMGLLLRGAVRLVRRIRGR